MSYVYQIKNKVNEKIYIGSSKDYKKRWKQHVTELNYNCHCNKYLQNAWNKYGEDNFEFIVLEEVPLELQFIKEQEYLNNLCPFDEKGYNIVRRIKEELESKHPFERMCNRCGYLHNTYSNLSKYCDMCREELREEETERYFNHEYIYDMGAFYAACSGTANAMGGWDNFWEDLYD